MCIGRIAFTTNDALMKFMFNDMSIFQAIFLRGAIALPFLALLAWFYNCLLVRLSLFDYALLCVRASAQIGMTVCFLSALAEMPIANVSAIMQAIPLSLIAVAAVFLGETIGWKRWTAVFTGFCGVLIVIRPGTEDFNSYSTLAVVAVAFATINDVVTRYLPNRVPAMFAAMFSAAAVCLFSGFVTISLPWDAVSSFNWLILSLSGLFVAAGYFFQVITMRFGEIGFIAPYRYVGMVWAIILGGLFFNEWPDNHTAVGIFIVVVTGLYSLYRERSRLLINR